MSLDRLANALADRYTIERELGQGGMATVYLARDLKHDREVAIKVLKPELAAVLGAERFVVEIKTTAALQHPHILPLFDSGEAGGFLWYAMPYIEGETLRDKLNRETQFGVDEAVRITREVADALDYAHSKGVVHRDIKPENILLANGRPMVADFGIALAVSAAAGGRMTETGLSLGTPHYMSPEQATADKEITGRSDVYSLASVCYEMLTGDPPHTGSSAQQIIMKIIAEEAQPVTALRKAVPPNVASAVARGLEKLPADRFPTAREFAEALGNPGFRHGTIAGTMGGPQHAGPRWRDPITVVLVACTMIATGLAAWAMRRPASAGHETVGRYAIVPDSTAPLAFRGNLEPARLALTPDGQTLVYVGSRATGGAITPELFVRPLGSLEARVLAGTAGATSPTISWDGAQVAFVTYAPLAIRTVPISGGPVITVADSALSSSPAWGPDRFVYFVARSGMIQRVSGSGGPIEDVVQLPTAPAAGEYSWLMILPDGRGAVVGVWPPGQNDDSRFSLWTVDLSTGALGVSLPGVAARYDADAKALVYVTPDGSLMAVPFDASTRELRGRPQVLAGGVAVRAGETDFDMAGGNLTYTLAGISGTEYLAWVNRADGSMAAVDTAWHDIEFESYALSPDGTRLAVTILGGGTNGVMPAAPRFDIWVKQLDRGSITRLTFNGTSNGRPAWTADGAYVSYTSERDGRLSLWRRRADGVGEEELVADIGRDIIESRWSSDGAWLVASVEGVSSNDIYAQQMGVDSTLRPLLAEAHRERKPSLSPDGKWLAYTSDESGTWQVFVRPFPDVQQGKWQISLDGGTDPIWSADSKELFYRSLDGDTILVADVARGPAQPDRRNLVQAVNAEGFEENGSDVMFGVSRDGRRFLVSANRQADRSGNLVIVQNFLGELKAALGAGRAKP